MTAGPDPSPPQPEREDAAEPESGSKPGEPPLEEYTSEPIESDELDDPSDSG
jgi:hypothetical protein